MKKQFLNEVKQFQKIAGILKETWHPDDPGQPGDDGPETDPDDFDDVSEDKKGANLRVLVDEGDAILEFTDVKNITDLENRIEKLIAKNPSFEDAFEWYMDAPHQLEVADQEAQYLFDEPIDSIPSDYVVSFKAWANNIIQQGNDD